MAANLFNSDVPDAVITNVLNLLGQIETAIKPYCVALSEDQKKHSPKISDQTIPFAQKVDAYLDSEPKYNPPYINIAETHKDFKNFTKLQPVMKKMDGLAQQITNMDIAAGSDAFVQFLAYYNSVKNASANGIPGAKAIYDELAQRFPGHKKPTPPAAAKP